MTDHAGRRPHRSAPLYIFLDLNDGLGIPVDAEATATDAALVGTFEPEQEHEAASALRDVCREFRLVVVNTHAPAGPTFWTAKGRGKRLDFILCGQGDFNENFADARVLVPQGRRLQLASSVKNWDHWPVSAAFSIDFAEQVRRNRQADVLKWDPLALRDELLHGERRQEVLDRAGQAGGLYSFPNYLLVAEDIELRSKELEKITGLTGHGDIASVKEKTADVIQALKITRCEQQLSTLFSTEADYRYQSRRDLP